VACGPFFFLLGMALGSDIGAETTGPGNLKLDSHADTGVLTPSVDWMKWYFSVAFSTYLSPSLIFHLGCDYM